MSIVLILHSVCLFIQSLFSCIRVLFTTLSGQEDVKLTCPGLPQDSYLSPKMFNVYYLVISIELYENGFGSLLYADDIVVLSRHYQIVI